MFPKDRRVTLVRVYDYTKSIRETAKICGVSKSTAQRWIADSKHEEIIRKHEETKQINVQKVSKLNEHLKSIEETMNNNPFATCRELSEKFKISKELARQCLHKLNLSHKKAKYYGKSKNALELTSTFLRLRSSYIQKGIPIYSIDETGFGKYSAHHRMGWCKKGKPLRVQREKVCRKNISVIACASNTKWVYYQQHIGGTKRDRFCNFLQNLPLPGGCVIMMDNASIHKGEDVERICADKKYKILYTPPYSPWFNPIESCFSIVKKHYPKLQNIDNSFKSVTTQHFESFFRHSLNTFGVDETESLLYKNILSKPYKRPEKPNNQPLKNSCKQSTRSNPITRNNPTTKSNKNIFDALVTNGKTMSNQDIKISFD